MIESIRIQNYKALHDVTLHLTPIHVLIGKNDSGKTSCLQAITALCRSTEWKLTSAFAGLWSSRDLVWKHSKELVVKLDAVIHDRGFACEYHIGCIFGAGERTCHLASEIIQIGGQLHHSQRQGEISTEVCHKYHGNEITSSIPKSTFASLHQSLSSVQNCRWQPSMLALPVAYDADTKQFEISPNGFGLPLLLDDILGDDMLRFADLVRSYQAMFPHVRSIKLVRESGYKLPPNDGTGVPRLKPGQGKAIRVFLDNDEVGLSTSQLSDGMLIALAYLAVLFSPSPPRVLLVEEPENGIHPERLLDVIKLLREVVAQHPDTQIVLTTHSPYLVSHFAPEEVTLCHKDPDGSVSLHRLSDSPEVKKQSSIFTLGEIWTGEGDDNLAKSTIPTGTMAP